MVINTNHIIKIERYTNLYRVYLSGQHTGTFFMGCGGFAPNYMKICEKEDTHDYKVMSNWIDKLDK